MTEAEWLAATNPEPMYKFLKDRVSFRKWRLFVCACCRRHWHWVDGTPAAKSIEVAELFADGRATARKLGAAQKLAHDVARDQYAEYQRTQGVEPYIAHMHASACADAARPPANGATADSAYFAISGANYAAQTYAYERTNTASTVTDAWKAHKTAEVTIHARVLREIVGNPFRPVAFAPAWRSADVQLLAEGIYEDRAWDRMPILADALQDAGCDSDELLSHLRDPSLVPWERDANATGPAPASHVRGCWALDLVLGLV